MLSPSSLEDSFLLKVARALIMTGSYNSGCITSSIRIPYIVRVFSSSDMTYDLDVLIFWSLGEMTCGFIVFCVPASLVVFSRFKPAEFVLALKSWVSSLSSRLRSTGGKSVATSPSENPAETEFVTHFDSYNDSSPMCQIRTDITTSSTSHINAVQQARFPSEEDAIVRTVSFTAPDEHDYDTAEDHCSRQNRWAFKSHGGGV